MGWAAARWLDGWMAPQHHIPIKLRIYAQLIRRTSPSKSSSGCDCKKGETLREGSPAMRLMLELPGPTHQKELSNFVWKIFYFWWWTRRPKHSMRPPPSHQQRQQQKEVWRRLLWCVIRDLDSTFCVCVSRDQTGNVKPSYIAPCPSNDFECETNLWDANERMARRSEEDVRENNMKTV